MPNNHTTLDPSRTPHTARARRADLARFEPLEPRILLAGDAPCILDIDADNRGLVVIEVSESLRAQSVNNNTVQIITPGNDGLLDSDDDTTAAATVTYNDQNLTITIDAENALQPNQQYAIAIDGDNIRSTDGNTRLDAEFNGSGQQTGDGTPGGQFLAFASAAPDDNLIARISTNVGDVDIRLFPNETPLHVANFFNYADNGLYDGTIFHRSVEDFVVQGGGFTDNPTDFEPIETFPPVQNEPGISNLRGTVALAKLGGDPNSGTSQFFFNVADNSGNLDNQNGGFTVFAEINDDDSLAVADAINNLTTINANSVQSAFTDLPVTDPDADPNNPDPDQLVLVSRVAALYQLTDSPQNQLGAVGNTAELNNPNGQGTVRVIDLTGNFPGTISAFIDVNWGPSGTINRLTIDDGARDDYAIQIQDADVNALIDRRDPDRPNQLKFIASDSAINRIQLAAPIDGFNLAGTALPGGFSFQQDIDGDGRTDDLTAIYVGQGLTQQFLSRAPTSGDAVFEGGLRRALMLDNTSNTDFRIGSQGLDADRLPSTSFNIRGDATDTGILSDLPVTTIIADSWTNADINRHAISAPSINTIISRGNFSPPTLETTNGDLRTLIARGDTRAADWQINGNVLNIRLNDTVNFSLDVNGDARNLSFGLLRNADILVNGSSNRLLTDDIDNATIQLAGPARNITIRGDAETQLAVNFDGTPTDTAAASLRINGNLRDSNLFWNGTINTVNINGDITDSELGSEDAGTGAFRAHNISDSSLNSPNRLRSIAAQTVTDSSISTFNLVSTAIFRGSYSGQYTATDTRNLLIDGDASFESFTAGSVGNLVINGNLSDSDMDFFLNSASPQANSATNFTVNGNIQSTALLLQLPVNNLSAQGLFDSNISLGTQQDILTLDDAGPDTVFNFGTINRLTIQPPAQSSNATAFANSTIVGFSLGNLTIDNPDVENDSQPFGLAANTISNLDIRRPNLPTIEFNILRVTPLAVQDLQIRPGFNPPPTPNA